MRAVEEEGDARLIRPERRINLVISGVADVAARWPWNMVLMRSHRPDWGHSDMSQAPESH